MLDDLGVARMTSLMMGFLSFAPYSNYYLHLVSKSCVPMFCLKGGRPSFVGHHFVMGETDLEYPIKGRHFGLLKRAFKRRIQKL